MMHTKTPETIVVLDNIRSAYNVGSIFRTAEGAGVTRIFLVGVTPAPVDRFGRIQPQIAKTSLGAAYLVPWEKIGDGTTIASQEAINLQAELATQGFVIVAVEQAPQAIQLASFVAAAKVAYIFGNEITGVQPSLLAAADQIVEIPLAGKKESLNVAVTAGIILFSPHNYWC